MVTILLENTTERVVRQLIIPMGWVVVLKTGGSARPQAESGDEVGAARQAVAGLVRETWRSFPY